VIAAISRAADDPKTSGSNFANVPEGAQFRRDLFLALDIDFKTDGAVARFLDNRNGGPQFHGLGFQAGFDLNQFGRDFVNQTRMILGVTVVPPKEFRDSRQKLFHTIPWILAPLGLEKIIDPLFDMLDVREIVIWQVVRIHVAEWSLQMLRI
jgi:hypothetical protein